MRQIDFGNSISVAVETVNTTIHTPKATIVCVQRAHFPQVNSHFLQEQTHMTVVPATPISQIERVPVMSAALDDSDPNQSSVDANRLRAAKQHVVHATPLPQNAPSKRAPAAAATAQVC